MKYQTLIDTTTLNAHLGAPDWVVVDCRFDLAKPAAGRAAYLEGHIPSAVYAHLDKDLSSPITPQTGRHPLPDSAVFAEKLGAWGIGAGTQVVAYDDANGAFAARLWWLLRWLGHHRVAVLDGGFAQWRQSGHAVEHGAAAPRAPARFEPRIDAQAWLTTGAVIDGLKSGAMLLIDGRTADRFAGQNEIIDPVAGHIPGAVNHPFPTNLDAGQRFLPQERLRQSWLARLNGRRPDEIVAMCGSGVTACHNLLALEAAGLSGARLYAGSWSEWIRDPGRPVAV